MRVALRGQTALLCAAALARKIILNAIQRPDATAEALHHVVTRARHIWSTEEALARHLSSVCASTGTRAVRSCQTSVCRRTAAQRSAAEAVQESGAGLWLSKRWCAACIAESVSSETVSVFRDRTARPCHSDQSQERRLQTLGNAACALAKAVWSTGCYTARGRMQ